MKLGYFVPKFPSQTHTFFWREIESLKSLGVEVHLFSTIRPRKNITPHSWSKRAITETAYIGVPTPKALILGAIKALQITNKDASLLFKKECLLFAPSAMRLKLAARRNGIDHIHVHSCSRSAFIAMLSYFMGGPSYSLTLHSALKDYGSFQCMKWRHAKFCTVVSDHLLQEAQIQIGDCFPEQVFTQPMGVDVEYFSRSAPYIPYRDNGPMKIFACGRLHKSKGHIDLIDAISILASKGVNAFLTIAGEDEQGGTGFRKVIEKHISESGLTDRVSLLGAVDGKIVKENLLNSHIFALASREEAIGVAYMEAMCCEIPTIGTRVGGVPELIEDGINGLLIQPNDAAAVVKAVDFILGDPAVALDLGKKGRETIIDGYTSLSAAQRLVKAVTVNSARS